MSLPSASLAWLASSLVYTPPFNKITDDDDRYAILDGLFFYYDGSCICILSKTNTMDYGTRNASIGNRMLIVLVM
jgi:hypothetical protein